MTQVSPVVIWNTLTCPSCLKRMPFPEWHEHVKKCESKLDGILSEKYSPERVATFKRY